jgi:hypothetical protein
MKLEQEVLEVTRSGSFQERGFSIAGNAKAFDILSSKIYTNVPLAIVRELSTNASDSHTDAGCPEKPFDVHLPNALEPWLTIRDYGTGLSPEAVETVYTTYFKSTRSTSDEFTGCLGLGSKSPFAYTDQFTIVSNWNGQQYTYSAFKNESSCPSLALLSTIETNEPNGLEIRISIRPGDANIFVKAAQRVYTFFKVRPNIVGAQVSFDSMTPEVITDNFALYTSSNNMLTSRVNVVMGQVCYSVDSYKVNTPFGQSAILTLNMPMGSVSIAASREEIHYDDKTIENVNAALQTAGEYVKTELESRVAGEATLMFKLRALAKYRNLVQGLSVQGTTHIESEEKDKYALKECSIRRGDKLFINMYHQDFRPGEYMENLIFIEDDAELTQNMKNRLRQFMRATQNGNPGANRTKFFLAKIKDMVRFEEVFGGVTTKLSLLPDVPRVPRDSSRATARSKPIKLLKEHSHDNMSFEWENVHTAADIDNTDACCVPRDGNWALWNGVKVRPDEVRTVATALGFKRVYGIAEKRYETSRIKHNIVELSAVAKDRAEKLMASLDTHALARFQHEDRINHRMDISKFAGLSPECDDLIKMRKSKIDNMGIYNRLCSLFNIQMPTAPDYQAKFFEKYPILVAIDWYSGRISVETVTDYIKMVEASIVSAQQPV